MGESYKHIKGNVDRLKTESNTIGTFFNEKYKNNEEFRNSKKEYQKLYRLKKKLLTNNTKILT